MATAASSAAFLPFRIAAVIAVWVVSSRDCLAIMSSSIWSCWALTTVCASSMEMPEPGGAS